MIVRAVTTEINEHYFEWLAKRGEAGIRSEVVMVLPRPDGRILTLTKSFYPKGTYNLPSGGIEAGETPELAFVREVAEETGLDVGLREIIGRIDHLCTCGSDSLVFISHIVLGTESATRSNPADPDESISAYKDASAADLRVFAQHMCALTGHWAGFGRFRATAMDFVADWLACIIHGEA